EHHETIDTPLGTNPLHPNVVSNPVVRLYEQDALRMGKKEQFPYVGTTYRLTEHFHTWTKHALLNAIAQPEQFVEISETLAAAKGINNGDRVTVSSKRGLDRKSTRLNSSHVSISYAVFCLKKKKDRKDSRGTEYTERQQ